jgi:hypothetical protein
MNNQNVIPAIKKEFSNFENKISGSGLTNQFYSYYQLFLFAAILLMVIEIFIPEKNSAK